MRSVYFPGYACPGHGAFRAQDTGTFRLSQVVRPHRRRRMATPHICVARLKTSEQDVGSLHQSGRFAKHKPQS